jgi:hypothetical protein
LTGAERPLVFIQTEEIMKLSDLLKRAEKRHEVNAEIWVTLLRIPTRIQLEIDRSRFKGLKFAELAEAVGNHGIDSTDNKSMMKLLGKNPDLLNGYDGGYSADVETLINGIDAVKHNITDDDGKPVILDRTFYENLYISNEPIFKNIIDAQKEYQAELSLGESTGS